MNLLGNEMCLGGREMEARFMSFRQVKSEEGLQAPFSWFGAKRATYEFRGKGRGKGLCRYSLISTLQHYAFY